jgi:hypothetical protein
MPKPPKLPGGDTLSQGLKSPTSRRAFIESFNKNVPPGCKVVGEEPSLRRLTYTCKPNKLAVTKDAVVKACNAYQLVDFESMNLRVGDGKGRCNLVGTCSCVGEPTQVTSNKDKDSKDKEDKDKPAASSGTFRGSLTGGSSGTVMITFQDSRVSGQARGTGSRGKFLLGFRGTVKDGKFVAAGTNNGSNVTVTGNVSGASATGSIRGTVNGQPASMSFSAKKK